MAPSPVTLGGERYVPTPEEQTVLDDCRRNALMRGAIYGVGTMLLGYPLVKRQVGSKSLTTLHRGALTVAGMTGAAVGMISYSAKCAEQLMSLEGSPMGESLRKAMSSQAAHAGAGRGANTSGDLGASSDELSSSRQARGVVGKGESGFAVEGSPPSDPDHWRQESTLQQGGTDDWTREPRLEPRSFASKDRVHGMATASESTMNTKEDVAAAVPDVDAFKPDTQNSPSPFFEDPQEGAPKKLTYEEIRRRHREAKHQQD